MTAIGRYELQEVIGAGSIAEVYRARDLDLEAEVALKVLHAPLAASPEVRAWFLAAAHRFAALGHRNIVMVYRTGEAEGRPYLAMQLLDGRTLEDVLTTAGPVEVARAVGIVGDLASAVDYLHIAGWADLRLTPASVMLLHSGRAVLLDFPLAAAGARWPFVVQPPVGAAALAFLAPEQVHGRAAGPPADIYGLGALAYALLAGRPPLDPSHPAGRPPALGDLRPDLPPSLRAVVEAALVPDPAARPPSARAFAAALAAALTDARPGGPARSRRPAPVRPAGPAGSDDAAPSVTDAAPVPAPGVSVPASAQVVAAPAPPLTGVPPREPTAAPVAAPVDAVVPLAAPREAPPSRPATPRLAPIDLVVLVLVVAAAFALGLVLTGR
jgi:serine/threonine protein kinase